MESTDLLCLDFADRETTLLACLARRGCCLLFDGDLRDEVPHLANRGLRLFFVGCIDFIADLLSRGIHRFELINRHGWPSKSVGRVNDVNEKYAVQDQAVKLIEFKVNCES